ncbi:MAG: Hsp20/alpha crystallin family protein [Bacteroidetes bacterium]|nr:Hsp20/alpha crystallin family protein [Bacteroidota bacterium]
MYQNQTCAAKGNRGGNERQLLYRSMERAAVNIYTTENSYEMLPRPEWVRREYSRGGFSRTFTLGATIDASAISAKYEDGVLHIHLPLLKGEAMPKQKINVV